MIFRRLILVLALVAFSAGKSAVATTYGLVVGIDEYRYLQNLRGAVNDARDVAHALRQAGAKVTLLLNQEATRRAIFDAWERIVAEAKPGDTVVFTYAGHGGQEPEALPGHEEDGLDEVFLLSGFRETRPGNGERIRDDEINMLFAAASHLTIIFVADSCHSGTMTRAFDTRAGPARTRLGSYGDIVDDALPPPSPAAAALTEDSFANVVFFGAVQDDELVTEITIDGRARGALSWAFARAVRGRADTNGDRRLDTRELERFLIEGVRTISEGRQLPQMAPRGRPVNIALPLPPVGSADIAGGPLRVTILGASKPRRLAEQLRDAVIVGRHETADLVWDLRDGQVVSGTGDVVARLPRGERPANFQAVIDKWLLLRDLRNSADGRALAIRLRPDNKLKHQGSQMTVTLERSPHRRLTLFNLASDGTVQFLAPAPQSPNRLYSGDLPAGRPFEFPVRVTPPYGADHLVALTSQNGLPRLELVLARLNGKRSAAELRRELAGALKGVKYRLGTVGMFTAP